MYWFGVESRMIFMCSMTSLKGPMSFMRSWLVMVAGTVRMHTIALRLTSSVHDTMDDLHRRIPTEEGDLFWELLGGRVWSSLWGGAGFLGNLSFSLCVLKSTG
ncbi:hypothetical protein GOODEAATRI_032486 [Goodea atripinnis]|uniref:Secreted protein n=1 Tax=Goodea atripinnis TaxID=208336 RepID=A0ABV0NFH9_9TELE